MTFHHSLLFFLTQSSPDRLQVWAKKQQEGRNALSFIMPVMVAFFFSIFFSFLPSCRKKNSCFQILISAFTCDWQACCVFLDGHDKLHPFYTTSVSYNSPQQLLHLGWTLAGLPLCLTISLWHPVTDELKQDMGGPWESARGFKIHILPHVDKPRACSVRK